MALLFIRLNLPVKYIHVYIYIYMHRFSRSSLTECALSCMCFSSIDYCRSKKIGRGVKKKENEREKERTYRVVLSAFNVMHCSM
jgi:hypothetical protein